MQRITITIEPKLLKKAKEIAARNNTSVSGLFRQCIHAMVIFQPPKNLSPIVKQATGIAKLPRGKSYRKLIEEAKEARIERYL